MLLIHRCLIGLFDILCFVSGLLHHRRLYELRGLRLENHLLLRLGGGRNRHAGLARNGKFVALWWILQVRLHPVIGDCGARDTESDPCERECCNGWTGDAHWFVSLKSGCRAVGVRLWN